MFPSLFFSFFIFFHFVLVGFSAALPADSSFLVADNIVQSQIRTTLESLLNMNFRPHAVGQADRFILNYAVPANVSTSSTTTVQYSYLGVMFPCTHTTQLTSQQGEITSSEGTD